MRGDDFTASFETPLLDRLDEAWEQFSVLKKMPRIGPLEFGGTSEGQFTKRTVSWSVDGFHWRLCGQARSDEKVDVTGQRARDAAEELVDEKRDGYRSMAPTAHTTWLWIARTSYINVVRELRWDFQYQEMPDEVYVEVDSGRRSTGGDLVLWCMHLLDSSCQQQHTISLSSAEAELHEVVKGAARGLFIQNVLQAMELKSVVRVGRDSSAAAGITQMLGAGRVRDLEVKEILDTRTVQVA